MTKKSVSNKANTKTKSAQELPSVLVEIIPAASGTIGVITLNAEKTLNSLSLEMVRVLHSTLEEWANNDELLVVVLKGQGERAFCAGGDIQALYHSATHPKEGVCVDAETFFYEEYQLNYLIHTYDKPIVCIGHGFVMGGGLGLMAGASHRIVTETTRLAMPEVTIGLFPDVGSTQFLNQVPYNLGYFLALTGIPINAADTLFCQLADFAVAQANIDNLIKAIQGLKFCASHEDNHEQLNTLIKTFAPEKSLLAASELRQNLQVLESTVQHNALCRIVDSINAFDDDNRFLSKARKTMQAGSPLSLVLIYEQLKRHRYLDLQSVFKSELTLATNMVRHPEFAEGVRALLIDKDKAPKWSYKHYTHIPCSVIESMFAQPWDCNPIESKLV